MEIQIDDMEHRVRKVIAEHREEAGFPKLEDYGVSEEDFDKQAVIDDIDSLKKKYTIYSIIFIIPFVVIAFYETTVRNTLIATGCGLLLCLAYYLLTLLVRKIRMSRMNNEAIERYITDVMKYQDQ